MRFFLALNRCCFTDFLPRPQPPIEAVPKPPLSVELGHLCLESAGGRRMLGFGWGHRSLPGRLMASCPPGTHIGALAPCSGAGAVTVTMSCPCVPALWPCSTSNSPPATTAGDLRPPHLHFWSFIPWTGLLGAAVRAQGEVEASGTNPECRRMRHFSGASSALLSDSAFLVPSNSNKRRRNPTWLEMDAQLHGNKHPPGTTWPRGARPRALRLRWLRGRRYMDCSEET